MGPDESPLDLAPPAQLRARLVSEGPSGDRRIAGYAVQGDLARHYSFLEGVLLALTGELPTSEDARAFELCLWAVAPATPADAGVHASILASIVGARPSGVLSVAVTTLAEAAHVALDELASLPPPPAELPLAARARDERERATIEWLRRGVAPRCVPALDRGARLELAVAAVLASIGLTRPEQQATAFAIAQLPTAVGESLAYSAGELRSYPTNVPPFRYIEGEP